LSLALSLYRGLVDSVVGLAIAPFCHDHRTERLGRAPVPPKGAPRIVLHAVSVGEMAAASALVAELRGSFRFVLTTGNAAGRAAAERLRRRFRQVEHVCYLPWDTREGVTRFLEAARPDAVVVVETELWPNLFHLCRERQTPLLVASGRLYPRDVARYRAARFLFRDVLASVSWIGAQTEAERAAFLAIGAPPERITVTGNLKLDAPAPQALDGAWERSLRSAGPIVVAGSTHAPEEELILAAFRALRKEHPLARLVLAPRHVERSATISPGAARFSEGPTAGWDVLVIDQLGVLASLYRHADVAVIGGSFAAKGGQSPLEAAAAGCPGIVGPDVSHVESLVDGLAEAGGLERLADGAALLPALRRLLAEPAERARMGAAARAFVAAHRGAARATGDAVRALVDRGASPSS